MTTPPTTEERIAHIEGLLEQINNRLGSLEQDVRMLRSDMNSQTGELGARIDRLAVRLDRLFYIQLGLIGAILVATVAALLTNYIG